MICKVKKIRFHGAYRELFARKVTVLRAEDGYQMRVAIDTGVVVVRDAKELHETALLHISCCDVYLEDDVLELMDEPRMRFIPSPPQETAPPLPAEPATVAPPAPPAAAETPAKAATQRGKDAPQLR
jgi:hypothetical protein